MKSQIQWVSLFFILLVGAVNAGTDVKANARGVVYEDANRNGQLDTGEKGIAGVLVSNGLDVVETDEEGTYELPVANDTILFVVQPKGWQVPVNELNLPQFYYIHKPAGSPTELKYKGVDPTGPLPESVNFALYPSDIGEAFSIFAFGDPQPAYERDVDYYKRDIVEEARLNKEPVAGVSLGDIVSDNLDLYGPMNKVTVLMDRPWWNVYGNHDMNQDTEDPEMTDETWEATYGPATYAFQIGNVVFIAMDNILYPNNHTDSSYIGGFTDKQLAFVENLLTHVPEENLVVTMVHIPLYEEWGDSFWDEDREAFFQLFKTHTHTLSLSAHTHTQNHEFFDHEHDHWPHIDAPHHHYNVGTTCGSWWGGPLDERGIPTTTMRDGVPNGWAILRFDGNQYIYDFKVANGPDDEVMNVHCPKSVRKGEGWTNAKFGVNVYNGSEQTIVEYRIDEGAWKKASHEEAFEPKYTYERMAADYVEIPAQGGFLPYPALSTHQWGGSLPKNLDAGTHYLDIRVTDRFGRVYEERASYELVE